MDLNPVALLPSAFSPQIPYTDLIEQLKIYGDADDTVSLSILTIGFSPDKFGVAVLEGVEGTEYVKEVSLRT